ncbi:MAG: HAMP domain-containing histidine kinase [Verrucomicrobia bacterium]|nr:HAMP domain-containing histidine kinase [Verrucomicrobiota bacterium]
MSGEIGPMIAREEELVYRARWLVRIRWLVAVLMAGGAIGAWLVGIAYPTEWLLVVAGTVGVYNILFCAAKAWASANVRRAYRFINIQIAADYGALLFWIYFTGGPVSFFLPFFAFHLVLSGILVSRRMTVLHAGLALAGLAVMSLAVTHGILRNYSPLDAAVTAAFRRPVFLFAVMVVTAVTLLTIALLVGGISNRLRRREVELAEAQHELQVRSDRLQEAYVKLRRLDTEKSSFYRLVSHQLRAPLSSIQTVLRTITGGYAGDAAKQTELVERAEKQSGELLDLINDMLELTKVKSLDEAEQTEEVELSSLLEAVVESSRNAAQQKAIRLETGIPRELPSLQAVRNRLQQMFVVLVENAVKYTPERGTVSVRAGIEGKRVVVRVRDSGIGIPPEAREHIFEEFYRAPNAKQHERVGTGLGLSIARKIVEQLGGSITFESTVGEGTTFTVSLPLSS